ncbi:biotin-dependent carboxyltransferase family protein [Corynebacterium pseudodiphtheriticum]|uniref:5-oxoprolinase subunit C family protein n=1 Tax=Corynebacterium pseudodiphtheriticum TaxID=37637 RepID=UPI0025432575|nr:biotin-dependent carboxyltransferase family protein [Corynebacterium pseudodiphtheriticum]MDK4236105.1 biotin-dependent carboxyltransferase family protein [Corynebacterium pseudodiphtheriticum]MDK4283339.1 biotin-dependent carboxyltransferase family protein [Corynebacterium pseudodiphtheriticum]MDK8395653.1 biotin-dependent carboxyltransferase family protein [Corynebacterium pseudodiphtheriticum]
MLKVLETGPQATFQDLGRAGYSGLGVSPSGAFDRGAARRANRMLGNDENSAVIEILFGGFEVVAEKPVRIVFTGTDADVFVDKRCMRTNTVLDIQKGQTVRLEIGTGLRAYLGISGGFAVEPVLGSVATDTLSGIGPDPITSGTSLPTNAKNPTVELPRIKHLPTQFVPKSHETLDIVLGPRHDWFAETAELFNQTFQISSDSDRIGVNLIASRPLQRAYDGELASEGAMRGALQIPPSGHPVAFGADHPITGGYPVIGVLTSESVDKMAQLSPGTIVTFRAANCTN